jgi:glycerophosphoryl diester phosphodiesterase
MKNIFLLFILIIFYSSCEKIDYYEDNPIVFPGTLSLAHRGGGCDSFRDNSYESCIHALSIKDGIEVDVELSKNRTVWLSHSAIVEGCEGSRDCFAETYDSEIENITTCNGQNIGYTKLADVMRYMNDHNIRKYISIDLKAWKPCGGASLDIEGEMRAEEDAIIKLGEDYNLAPYLIFETEVISVLDWAKAKNKSVKIYYTSFGDYEKGMLVALEHHCDGISYKSHFKDELDLEKMNLLHKKGLRLMAWNIPDSTYANYLKSIDVDIIQVDL